MPDSIRLSRSEALRLQSYVEGHLTRTPQERLELLTILHDRLNHVPGRRVPLQASHDGPAGTITWEEHLECHRAYCKQHPGGMSAEEMAVTGFGHGEFLYFVGREPTSFIRN